jgi:hypothetical protein
LAVTESLVLVAGVIMGVVAADTTAPHLAKFAKALQQAFARRTGR